MRRLVRLAGIALLSFACSSVEAAPIRWSGWTSDLFERAKAEKRLVLLDLEAVWCHWCHVMDRKTYGDPRIQDLVAAKFVAVRADQDANPDLSARYGPWGWPATIVFAPDGTEIAKLSGYVEADALNALLRSAVEDPTPGPSVDEPPRVTPSDSHFLSAEQRKALTATYDESYDGTHGGWGEPLKFIDAASLDYALLLAERGDAQAARRARETLDKALALIDPVWGGVYQYSDALDWSSPHYEKIMSFQAQYLRQYSLAYARWKEPRYEVAAQAIKRYLTAFLLDPSGAFRVSQNADLDHETDGHAFYALDDAGRRAKGMPRIDPNLYARENGWAISGLAAYANAFGDEEALRTARRAAEWVKANRALPEGGFRHGENDRGGPFLGDTLAMGQAFLDLHAATGDRVWLDDAERAAAFIATTFKVSGSGFASAARGESASGITAAPMVASEDQAPTIRFLNLLGQYTGRPQHRALAEHGMRYLIGVSETVTWPLPDLLLADQELARAPTHLTIVGHKNDDAARSLFTMARALPGAFKRIEWWDTREGPLANPDVEYPDLGKAAAFACSGSLCSLPTFSAKELQVAVAEMEKISSPKKPARAAR